MAEYIKRDVVMKEIMAAKWMDGYDGAMAMAIAASAPAADVAPVMHSYWEHKITSREENISICHNCKYPVSWFWGLSKYCPNCGAKMDGVDDG